MEKRQIIIACVIAFVISLGFNIQYGWKYLTNYVYQQGYQQGGEYYVGAIIKTIEKEGSINIDGKTYIEKVAKKSATSTPE
ncbi:MAG TPA: hypothetical protein P5056_04245 [Candidatus Paceibacterota bacterium]|nr:hypothetical protein [Candidatus Paceibacterota bacterium]